MSKVGIDFVIGAKNLAGTAFDAVITSLGAASKASVDFSKSFATISRGVTQSIGNLTTAAGTFASTMAQGVSRSLGTLAQSAAKSISTIAQGFAKARAVSSQAEARTEKILASIKPQMASVEKSLKQVETGMGRLEKASKSLMSTLAPLLAVVAAVKTAMAAVGGINAAKEAFDAQTESVKRLNSALNIRGAGQATAQMQAFGKQMEAVTGISATAINQLQAQAIAMGIATDRVDDATKASLGLAEATGKTAEQSLGDLTAALQGNFAAFEGVNPQIKFMATNQQKLNAVLDIANQGLNMHGNSLNTVEGSGRRANTAMQNFLEVVGKILEPVRILVNTGLQQLWSSLQKLLAPAAEKAGKMMEQIGPIMQAVQRIVVRAVNAIVAVFKFWKSVIGAVLDWFKPAIKTAIGLAIKALVALEVYMLNLPVAWEIIKAATEFALISITENIKYYLTEVIPQYLKWFTDNVPNFFNDAFQNAITVVKNAGQIIADSIMGYLVIALNAGEWFGKNLWKYMEDALNGAITIVQNGGKKIAQTMTDILMFSSGQIGVGTLLASLNQSATGLMDGFTATVKDKATDFTAEFDTIGKNASKGLMDGMQSTVSDLPGIVGRQLTAKEQDLVDQLKALGTKLGDEFAKKLEERLTGVGDILNAEMSAADQQMSLFARPQAAMQGVQAKEGRLLTRGPASDIPLQMLQQLQRIAARTQQTAESSQENVAETRENKEATNQVAANTTGTLQLVMTT